MSAESSPGCVGEGRKPSVSDGSTRDLAGVIAFPSRAGRSGGSGGWTEAVARAEETAMRS